LEFERVLIPHDQLTTIEGQYVFDAAIEGAFESVSGQELNAFVQVTCSFRDGPAIIEGLTLSRSFPGTRADIVTDEPVTVNDCPGDLVLKGHVQGGVKGMLKKVVIHMSKATLPSP
jgi:hypothetical protein